MCRNYVVQHLLEMEMPELTKYILRRFEGCFVSLSCNKYASNVVEKLLRSGEEVSAIITIELLQSPNASMLLVDPYGNFVIQNALSATKVRDPTLCFDAFETPYYTRFCYERVSFAPNLRVAVV